MPKTTDPKRAAKKQARKPAKRAQCVEVERVVEELPPTTDEQEACARLIAQGCGIGHAVKLLRRHLAADDAAKLGSAWMPYIKEYIGKFRGETVKHAGKLFGISKIWSLRHKLAMLKTPLSQIGPDNIYCKKYKLTSTMTEAGPKETLEVEKDAPLAILASIDEMMGWDQPDPVPQVPAIPGQGGEQTVTAWFGMLFANGLVQPGSPVQRRLGQATGQPDRDAGKAGGV